MNVNRTILLVDDDPINLRVMVGVLQSYECLTASTGEEAVEICTRLHPDVVLLDILMPGIDGYETCRRLRANPESRGMKIVLISAKSMAEDRIAGYRAGADDYLIKPFNHDELRAKIEVFMRLKTSEELNDLKTSLLNLVAHEIRTPLTGILPVAEILLNETEVSEEDRKAWAAIILENGSRLMTLAERGLILCQLRAEMGVSMKRNEILFAKLLESQARDAMADTGRSDIRITSQDTSRATVLGDRDLLSVALEVIVTNVIQACEEGRNVQIDVRDDSNGVEFSIVAESIAKDVDFTELFAVFAERKTDGEVVGGSLDLALAREIVRAHGGRIDVEPGEAGAGVVGWLPTRSGDRIGVAAG